MLLGGLKKYLNRRLIFTFANTETWSYNAKGEVITADHSTKNEFDRAFEFDGIGNRKKSVDSLTLPTTDNYTANALNQLTEANGNTRVHDADGNITDNGTHLYFWDAENRLIEIKLKSDNSTVATYGYDFRNRRVSKSVGSNNSIYAYDGWKLIAEYSNSTLNKSYTWGMDLSGEMHGAGGVGGLLSVNDGSATYYPTFDGNGNVSEYVDVTGNVVAHYEYDAFGQVVPTGSMKDDFIHQFSTKQMDSESDLHYYGYRYYESSNGRWLGRDPMEEDGGFNIYGFIGNNPIYKWDRLGLIEGWTNVGSDVTGRDVWQNNDSGRRFQVSYKKVYQDNSFTIERVITEVTQSGTGWESATRDLLKWLTANTPGDLSYGEADNEVQLMKKSAVASKLRDGYKNKFKDKKCSEWADYTNVKLAFGAGEFLKDLKNGRAHFVGSGRGDAFSESVDSKTCKVKAKFVIVNTTSLKSALYHLTPNGWNRTGGGAAANWTQTYTWHEEFKCKKE